MTFANWKRMMVVDGKTVVMDKEMTTKNGTVVVMDGTVKMNDEKTIYFYSNSSSERWALIGICFSYCIFMNYKNQRNVLDLVHA